MIPRMKIINKYNINCSKLFKEKCKLYIIYKKTIFQTKYSLSNLSDCVSRRIYTLYTTQYLSVL